MKELKLVIKSINKTSIFNKILHALISLISGIQELFLSNIL